MLEWRRVVMNENNMLVLFVSVCLQLFLSPSGVQKACRRDSFCSPSGSPKPPLMGMARVTQPDAVEPIYPYFCLRVRERMSGDLLYDLSPFDQQ